MFPAARVVSQLGFHAPPFCACLLDFYCNAWRSLMRCCCCCCRRFRCCWQCVHAPFCLFSMAGATGRESWLLFVSGRPSEKHLWISSCRPEITCPSAGYASWCEGWTGQIGGSWRPAPLSQGLVFLTGSSRTCGYCPAGLVFCGSSTRELPKSLSSFYPFTCELRDMSFLVAPPPLETYDGTGWLFFPGSSSACAMSTLCCTSRRP